MFSVMNRGNEYGVYCQLSLANLAAHILPYSQVPAVYVDPLSLERRAGVGQQAVALVDAEERLRGSEEGDGGPQSGWSQQRSRRSESCSQHVIER